MRMVQRALPAITTPTDSWWSWWTVQLREATPTLTQRVRLWFQPWEDVCAPLGTPCEVMNLRGQPLYQYKRLDERAFYLRAQASPGFPGS